LAWTKKISFSSIAEYYGLVNDITSIGKRGIVTFEGKTGPKHTDNGFRLRSASPGTRNSWSGVDLKESLQKVACPLDPEDRGVYWITVTLSDSSRWDYIGEADGEAIWERLIQHFIKMAGTTDFIGKTSDAEGYRKFRKYMKDNNLTLDFNKDVAVSFNKVKQTKDSKKKIHKGEGMAIEAFKNLFGYYPVLNTRDETTELMEGFGS
jgi:hypothetical protein